MCVCVNCFFDGALGEYSTHKVHVCVCPLIGMDVSVWFPVNVVLSQGCVMPWLFNVHTQIYIYIYMV